MLDSVAQAMHLNQLFDVNELLVGQPPLNKTDAGNTSIARFLQSVPENCKLRNKA
jgi:hypothetical protein